MKHVSWFSNKFGRGHRDKVQQFMAITGANEKAAVQALKASDWHLEGAFDVFYSQPQIKTSTDSRHLEELYNRYKGEQWPSFALFLLSMQDVYRRVNILCPSAFIMKHNSTSLLTLVD
ncbi:DCN1-like protein 1 [Linum grandiflorum]